MLTFVKHFYWLQRFYFKIFAYNYFERVLVCIVGDHEVIGNDRKQTKVCSLFKVFGLNFAFTTYILFPSEKMWLLQILELEYLCMWRRKEKECTRVLAVKELPDYEQIRK